MSKKKIRTEYNNTQKKASIDSIKSTCHILKFDNGIATPLASGVFVRFNDDHFLIGAAHTFDKDIESNCIGIESKKVFSLGGELIRNKFETSRDDDRIDAAVIKLDQESIDMIHNVYEFLDLNDIEINHKFIQNAHYQIVGFPATLSQYNKFKEEIKSKPFVYKTSPGKKNSYGIFNCEEYQNFLVNFNRKRMYEWENNKADIGPEPYGLSGSGFWYIPPNQIRKKGQKVEKKLVGILNEWPKKINDKFLIGTRIDIYTEIIRKKYSLDIPRTKLFNLSVEIEDNSTKLETND